VRSGRYSVHVTLYERLGGRPVSHASSEEAEDEGWELQAKTGPKQHAARPREDTEIFFNQPLQLVLPPEDELQPAMCLVFELVMLKGRLNARDTVKAWGAFPICDATFRYMEGQFKVPLLLGDVDKGQDKYGKIERTMAAKNGLDRWLCNLYFDVELSARENRTGSEYDQRLDYAQEVLRLPPLSESALALEDGDAATRKKKRGAAALHAADRAARAELALQEYRFSMQPRKSARSLRSRRTLDALEVVRRNLTAEIYATQWRTTSFVGQVMLTLSAFVLRHYVHYFGQLLYLYALGVPVTKFAIRESGVLLLYDTQQLAPYTEMAVVAIGMLSVWIVQLLFISAAAISMKCVHSFADSYSMFLLSCCVVTLLDPYIVLLNDVYHSNWSNGDAFKLYNSFVFTEGNGVVGIGITVFLFIIHGLLSFCSSYLYLVNLHRNGQVQDLLHRSEAQEDEFFVPHDDEISWAELVRRAITCVSSPSAVAES